MYLWGAVVRFASVPQVIAAEEYIQQQNFSLHGIIAREETLISFRGIGAVPVVSDGQAVATGSTVAVWGEQNIPAPIAGIYVNQADGFEHLTADMLSKLTPEKLEALPRANTSIPRHAGKIIGKSHWFLAVTVEAECTALLQEGGSVELNAQVETPFSFTATVIHISPAENGRCTVVFRCIDHLQNILQLRQLTVLLPHSRVEGLSIPTQAIHTDETGCFVYVLSASTAEKKYVTILSEGDVRTVVSKDSSADALRAGDNILISPLPTKELG